MTEPWTAPANCLIAGEIAEPVAESSADSSAGKSAGKSQRFELQSPAPNCLSLGK